MNATFISIFVSLCTELIRNMVGFFLVSVGVTVICLGAHWHMDVLVTLGTATMIPAAMLALQSKRTPEGNTTTTQVTVPPPMIADVPPATPPVPVVTGIERETGA
jgi:hypothetical protein